MSTDVWWFLFGLFVPVLVALCELAVSEVKKHTAKHE